METKTWGLLVGLAWLVTGCLEVPEARRQGANLVPAEDADEAGSTGDVAETEDTSDPYGPDAPDPGSEPEPPENCGDGIVDPDEACDGNAPSCAAMGFDGGDAACTSACTVDTIGCTGCGNDRVEAEEACDGLDVDGQTCVSLGFATGTVSCRADCSDFDTSECKLPYCGDDQRNADEACDGTDFGGQTCASMDPSFVGGELHCTESCTVISTAQCRTPVCGDGMREGDEVCDGTDIGASTCGSQGFDAGTLACSGACDALDTSGCLVCEQAGESCAADPQGCCPGLACTDFGADLVICF